MKVLGFVGVQWGQAITENKGERLSILLSIGLFAVTAKFMGMNFSIC